VDDLEDDSPIEDSPIEDSPIEDSPSEVDDASPTPDDEGDDQE
jgi:hypothetical protein